MSSTAIRIFSDLHFGDRASALKSLPSLIPLFDGADQIVLNGDTLDTRPSNRPMTAAALRIETLEFFSSQAIPVTLINGNHDPNVSPFHSLGLGHGSVFVTHGDVLFDDVVPWGRDAAKLRRLVAAELATVAPGARHLLSERLAAVHRAAALVPQRHQSERHGLKYLLGYLADTVWPPTRIFRVLRTWRETPGRAAAFVRRYGLPARFFVMGHTHRLGAELDRDGLVVLNTGSFCRPADAGFVDVTTDRISLHRIERRRGEFRPGSRLAEFPLAPG